MWIGFSRLLIMTVHVRDTPGKGRTLLTMRGSSYLSSIQMTLKL